MQNEKKYHIKNMYVDIVHPLISTHIPLMFCVLLASD